MYHHLCDCLFVTTEPHTTDLADLCVTLLLLAPGGASTQIIFRHKAAGHPKHADEEAAENDARNGCPCHNQQPTTVANYDGSTSTSCSRRGGSSAVPTRDSNGTCTVPEGEGSHADGEGGRGRMGTVPVSRADFWGASHLGYGVTEVSSYFVTCTTLKLIM